MWVKGVPPRKIPACTRSVDLPAADSRSLPTDVDKFTHLKFSTDNTVGFSTEIKNAALHFPANMEHEAAQ
ncbi:hypothetical protein CDAR_277281 [Caerostris darwini]|uniref:Uncharacterized protein n=1 Tax=Caerostris darwini TaxID=1538125 RepID=A0AAV4VSX0_9ARAC|nr:hypothetical protein CDAR_277281 [Caerostris darwini]